VYSDDVFSCEHQVEQQNKLYKEYYKS